MVGARRAGAQILLERGLRPSLSCSHSPRAAASAKSNHIRLKTDAPENDIFYDETLPPVWCSGDGLLKDWAFLKDLRRRLNEGTGMTLRRVGLGLFVGAILMAPSVASAAPALVFEPYNGTVLYAEDPDAQWFPASLAKLMTAYVTFQALKAGTVSSDTKVVCSQKARTQAPTKLGLPVGAAITLDVALKVLIVKSANDVAVMIAETVAPSEQAFVARMNEEAQRLGMTRTNFANVNGLPDERQVSTARDLAKLARAIIVEFPEHADLFSSIQVQVGKRTMRTHNNLLVSLPGADGMKTGFICKSGFNVVASATRDGRKIVAVVLGEPSVASRNARATDLLEKGFRRHFWKSCSAPASIGSRSKPR